MRGRPAAGTLRAAPLLAALVLTQCRRELPPPPPPPAPAAQLDPWTFHFVGGLVVISGETADTVEVTLKGTTFNERRTLPFGPVRWELLRPPPHEVAELRTVDGKLLAKFNFDGPPPPRTAPAPPWPSPQAAPVPAGPPAAPGKPAVGAQPPPTSTGAPARVPSAGPGAPARPQAQAAPPPVPAAAPAGRTPAQPMPDRAQPAPKAPALAAAGAARGAQVPAPARPQAAPLAPPVPAGHPASQSAAFKPARPGFAAQAPPPPAATPGPRATVPAPGRPQAAASAPPQPASAPGRAGRAGAVPQRPQAGAVPPPGPASAPARQAPAPWPGHAAVAPQAPPPPGSQGPARSQTGVPIPVSVTPSRPQPSPSAPVQPAPRPVLPPAATPAARAAKPAEAPAPRPSTTAGHDWPGAGEGANLLRGPQGDRRICLTFDGGSTAEVAVDVLDALKARGIRTTLFLTGDFIRKYPDLVRRMDREGHELGNHTLTHPHLAPGMRRDPRWTKERFQQELLEADRALLRLIGRPFDPYWRAPYGEQTNELRQWAEELGYRHVGWSEGADTLDWATTKERKLYRTGNAILDRLRARMEKRDGDGLIVLMHLGSGRPDGDRPAQVLGPFLDRALQDGWHFVAIGEYVKGLGKPRWEAVRRVALLR